LQKTSQDLSPINKRRREKDVYIWKKTEKVRLNKKQKIAILPLEKITINHAK